MIDKFNKKSLLLFALLTILILPGIPSTVHAYSVSGVVEFSYADLTRRSGNSEYTESYSVQNYSINVGSYILDPRLLTYSASAGYMFYSSDIRNDAKNLTYSLTASLLPGKIFSANLYAGKTTQTIKDNTTLSGYDVDTTSYSGTLSLKLNSIGKGGNNGNIRNNNNNNNNNNRGGASFLRQHLPDIFLTRDHIESESLSKVNPFHEARDNTNAELQYRSTNLFDVSLRSQLEQFENLVTKGKYDIQSNYFNSNVQFSPDSKLRLSGSTTDKTYDNFYYPGIRKEETTAYLVGLSVAEREKLSQEYSYAYSTGKADAIPSPAEATKQDAKALVRYRLTNTVNTFGGLVYQSNDYKRDPNPITVDIGQDETLQSVGAQAGLNYAQEFRTNALGTWSLSSSYTGTAGSNDFTRRRVDQNNDGVPDDLNGDGIPDEISGSGAFYSNGISLGVGTGWGQETLSTSYSYLSSRDDSPLNNDYWKSSVSLSFTTTRIPRARIYGTGSYSVQDNSADFMLQLPSVLANMQYGKRRETSYSIVADYSIMAYLRLNAGASRGLSTSNYSLATLTAASALTDDTSVYGALNLVYPLTRYLTYKANYGRDVRTANLTNLSVVTDRFLNSLDFHIRSLFFSAEYSWMKSTPENELPFEDKRIYLTLRRPF